MTLDEVVSFCKEYGYIFPSSDIYDGLAAVYDYGQNGVELKNNLKQYWWDAMTRGFENIVGIDASIMMHPTVWEASGHVASFNDLFIDDKLSQRRYRADDLIEAKLDALHTAGDKRYDDLKVRYDTDISKGDLADLKQILLDEKILPGGVSKVDWTDIRKCNLMFSTQMGANSLDTMTVYLRPETAQGIYVNFLNVQKSGRMKVPFGIAQIGKAFRNEMIARQFLFRMKEFEQMEMQFFIAPGTEQYWFNFWKAERMRWHNAIGCFEDSDHRFHDHEKLAHYASAATDIEYQFPTGYKEVEGIHSRTNYDLSQHAKYCKKKLEYFDPTLNKNYTPYVLETSIGVDRLFLSVIFACLRQEQLENDTRVVLSLPGFLAPTKMAILPLTKKDGLPEYAHKIYDDLHLDYKITFDEKDSIGKRYRRQDALGTPYCITVDNDSLHDDTVTIRERDSMSQKRVKVSELASVLHDEVSRTTILKRLFEQRKEWQMNN